MLIKLKRVRRCGLDVLCPVCKNAGLLCEMAGKRTFNKEMLELVKRLGFDVRLVEGFSLSEWFEEDRE